MFPSPMASSKKLATTISSIASVMYFLLIIFQIPLFRVPCRFGICRTPIEITSSQLISSELFPTYFVKILLYPGAFAYTIIRNHTLPSYGKLLNLYNTTGSRKSTAISDLQRLEVGLRTDCCRKLLVCGGSFCRPVKAGQNEPVWDNAYNMGPSQGKHSGTISWHVPHKIYPNVSNVGSSCCLCFFVN
ncbi:hypothetical protein V6N13_083979 [Hibiscus sabdariffa]|uniref:Uncharacterized protein n=1 Tax=Hibiscus sabdariffa TaxID=183260 RepID=A0ABR2T068_9ROSI